MQYKSCLAASTGQSYDDLRDGCRPRQSFCSDSEVEEDEIEFANVRVI